MHFSVVEKYNKTTLVYGISDKGILEDCTVKMFDYNRISCFIPFYVHYHNNECLIEYDISGLKAISESFKNNIVTRKQLCDIINSMFSVFDTAREYLLNPSSIVWNMDYIYYDPLYNNCYVVYVPTNEELSRDNSILHFIFDFFRYIKKDARDIELEKMMYLSLKGIEDGTIKNPERIRILISGLMGDKNKDINSKTTPVVAGEKPSALTPEHKELAPANAEAAKPESVYVPQKSNMDVVETHSPEGMQIPGLDFPVVLEGDKKNKKNKEKKVKEKKVKEKNHGKGLFGRRKPEKQDVEGFNEIPNNDMNALSGKGNNMAAPNAGIQNNPGYEHGLSYDNLTAPKQDISSSVAYESVQTGGNMWFPVADNGTVILDRSGQENGNSAMLKAMESDEPVSGNNSIKPANHAMEMDSTELSDSGIHPQKPNEIESDTDNSDKTEIVYAEAHLINKETKEKIDISENVFKIGRSSDCNYKIDSKKVSHYHARIERIGCEYYITDTNSLNHIYINDIEIPVDSKTKLKDGDTIRIVSYKFDFVLD